MRWLPSFVKLFLLFVTGLVLSFAGAIAQLEFFENHALLRLLAPLRLIGLVFTLGSSLLMALKFFARLDQKDK